MEADSKAALTLRGTPVFGPAAYGPIVRAGARPQIDDEMRSGRVVDEQVDRERQRFTEAAAAVSESLRVRADRATGSGAKILTASAALAQDRGWIGAATALIGAGSDAAAATIGATEKFTALFTDMGGLMAERVVDLEDIRDRVLAVLTGADEPGLPMPSQPSVLIAEDLAPADTVDLDPSRIIALVTRGGGPTSHTAIIARDLAIPCVVAVAGLDTVLLGPGDASGGAQHVLVDGDGGTVTFDPDPEQARRFVESKELESREISRWEGPGTTSDGHPVAVLANVSDGASARKAADHQVEGVGLFRTELAFLDRRDAPSVEEQAALYREVFDAFEGRKVVIRTLDAGSDKPLAFIEQPVEDNPALGVRGDRISVRHPDIRDTQLDAIAAAGASRAEPPWVMAPMIATVAQASDFAAAVHGRGLRAGVMVEIPAAALLADRIFEHVDFVSIGTNDLTQYTMAADRMSAELAALTDPWHPAVLALIERVGVAGTAAGKPVGVCGEAAADPLLACVLVGLGVGSLSCAPSAAAAVGSRLARHTQADCVDAANAACRADDAATARAAAASVLDHAGPTQTGSRGAVRSDA